VNINDGVTGFIIPVSSGHFVGFLYRVYFRRPRGIDLFVIHRICIFRDLGEHFAWTFDILDKAHKLIWPKSPQL
jgi:hypothetical protein